MTEPTAFIEMLTRGSFWSLQSVATESQTTTTKQNKTKQKNQDFTLSPLSDFNY